MWVRETNVTDMQINRLRNKIDRDSIPSLRHTVRGGGYTMVADEQPDRADAVSSACSSTSAGSAAAVDAFSSAH